MGGVAFKRKAPGRVDNQPIFNNNSRRIIMVAKKKTPTEPKNSLLGDVKEEVKVLAEKPKEEVKSIVEETKAEVAELVQEIDGQEVPAERTVSLTRWFKMQGK
jgi:tRNA G10  N-methylase Trm11